MQRLGHDVELLVNPEAFLPRAAASQPLSNSLAFMFEKSRKRPANPLTRDVYPLQPEKPPHPMHAVAQIAHGEVLLARGHREEAWAAFTEALAVLERRKFDGHPVADRIRAFISGPAPLELGPGAIRP